MSQNVRLRAVIPADNEVFFRNQMDPEAAAMVGFVSREREDFLAHRAKIDADPAAELRTIVAGGEVAGNMMSWVNDAGHREVGYWLGKEFWGRGIATEALRAFLAELQHRPLHAYVANQNAGSRRVLEKCGFRLLSTDEEGANLILDK